MKLNFHPVTPDRWKDLETLFGPRGACGGCWCQFWKTSSKEYDTNKGESNKKALKRSVVKGAQPGIIAYDDGEPVAWCAVEPRSHYSRLAGSRVLSPIDDQPVWSIPCFFVKRTYRRKGVTTALLKAAVDYARTQGAKILEGYPVESVSGKMPDAFSYTGFPSSFEKAGFKEAARRSEHRPIYRKKIGRG